MGPQTHLCFPAITVAAAFGHLGGIWCTSCFPPRLEDPCGQVSGLLGPPSSAPGSGDGTMCRFHDGKTEASAVACCQPGAYGLCPHVDSSVTWMGSCRSSRALEVAGVPRALCSPDTDCPLAPSFQKCEVRRASGDRKSPGLGMRWHLCLQLQTLGWPGKQGSFQQGAHPAGRPGLVL